MAEDKSFNEIMKLLKDIHKDYPDMRFGLVLQSAMDIKTKSPNTDFHNLSSKKIKTSLEEFKEITKGLRKGGKK